MKSSISGTTPVIAIILASLLVTQMIVLVHSGGTGTNMLQYTSAQSNPSNSTDTGTNSTDANREGACGYPDTVKKLGEQPNLDDYETANYYFNIGVNRAEADYRFGFANRLHESSNITDAAHSNDELARIAFKNGYTCGYGPSPAKAEMIDYENPDFRLVMKYPSNWAIQETTDYIAFTSPAEDEFDSYLESLYVYHLEDIPLCESEDETLEKNIEATIVFREPSSDFQLLSSNNIEFNGKTAGQIEYTYTDPKIGNVEAAEIIAVDGNDRYNIVFIPDLDWSGSSSLPTRQEMMDSIEITPSQQDESSTSDQGEKGDTREDGDTGDDGVNGEGGNDPCQDGTNGKDGDRISFNLTVAGGFEGIQISKISYDSNTKELRVGPKTSGSELVAEKTRQLSDTEENNLKDKIMKSGFFEAGNIQDPICNDCFVTSLMIRVDNKARSESWNIIDSVVVPKGILNALESINDLTNFDNKTNASRT